jgi:Deoxyribonuclease NucA/NucB
LAQATPVEPTQPVAPENAPPQSAPIPFQPLQPGEVREEIAPEYLGNDKVESGTVVPAQPEKQGGEGVPQAVPPQPQQPENQSVQPNVAPPNGLTGGLNDVTSSGVLGGVTSPGGLKRFDLTVVKGTVVIEFLDAGTEEDGDLIRPVLEAEDGTVLSNVTPFLLTKRGYSTTFVLKGTSSSPANGFGLGGTYRLRILPVSGGKTPAVTAGVRIAEKAPDSNGVQRIGNVDTVTASIGPGQEAVLTLGFPQIAVCTNPRPASTDAANYPCTKNGNAHPESAAHIEEARQIPPSPITAPLRPAKTPGETVQGNRVPRGGYPRLLTIDRGTARSRRTRSTAPYQCPNSQEQDRDEYPQALFSENGGSAHIKCITIADNRGSGSAIETQLNGYTLPRKDGSDEVVGKLPDGYVVEVVTIP